jgi:hypothetical protein
LTGIALSLPEGGYAVKQPRATVTGVTADDMILSRNYKCRKNLLPTSVKLPTNPQSQHPKKGDPQHAPALRREAANDYAADWYKREPYTG